MSVIYMTDAMRELIDKIREIEVEFRKLETIVQTDASGVRIDYPKDISGYIVEREFELDDLEKSLLDDDI